MQGIAIQNFVPLIPLSATLPPEEDFDLTFELREEVEKPSSSCGAKTIVTCSLAGVDPEKIESATLVWRHCGLVAVYDTDPNDIILDENGKIIEIEFSVDDFNLSNVNDYELTVFSQGYTTLIARGRVFINTVIRTEQITPPTPEPPDGDEEWVYDEIPNGAINGVNTTFVTDFPFVPETVIVYVNGLRQSKPDDWNNTDDQTIVLTFSLMVGEEIAVTYLKA